MLHLLVDLIFTRRCIICNSKTARTLDCCDLCEKALPILNIAQNNLLKNQLDIEEFIIPYRYENIIRQLILTLKFGEKLYAARVLGNLFTRYYLAHYKNNNYNNLKDSIILPVPLHDKRLRTRGFNQSLEIAKIVAKNLELTIANNLVIRTRNTPPQSNSPNLLRAENMVNAFSLAKNFNKNNKKYKYKHIIIFDDVITTGHTVHAIIQILRDIPTIETIAVWAIARAAINKY